jgi:hypothetical protein
MSRSSSEKSSTDASESTNDKESLSDASESADNEESVSDASESTDDEESVVVQKTGVLRAVRNKDIAGLLSSNTYYEYDSECLRKKSNWSKTRPEFKFDTKYFDPVALSSAIHTHSSKLESLLKRIDDLDKRDMARDGRKYKHFIFSDLKTGLYGAKLIAGALMAKGMHLGYSAQPNPNPKSKKSYEKIILDEDDTLLKTKFNNFYLLSSVAVYDQPISVAMKKTILKKFNQRPENVYGELARIIVMDSGYKEGIDLFDIKYVHIYEPQITMADQKQVIGRGTRTCGQKGLDFHPTKGWPLHVFIYDVDIPAELRRQMLSSSTLFDLYMKSMNIDFRLFNFQHDIERATVYGSVDYELNRDIHNFAIEPDHDDMMFGGSKTNKGSKNEKKIVYKVVFDPRAPKFIVDSNLNKPMDFEQNRAFVRKYFSEYKWKDIKMENNCVEKKVGGAVLLDYTPTQDFIRNYFTPQNPVKGMFLWHSVGTGKTCSAIATATSSFEREGYTILWVTRTTLKNDIWKNMFDQVCNENIRKEIENLPNEHAKRMRMLSKSWSIRPMSYKQFSNLVSKQNSFYSALVKKNGEADPLQKTLLIIDEAHKLYGGEDLSSIERPDMQALNAALQNSYIVSGKNSVRLLLMTATPITGNPMELVKLINLLKPMDQQMPDQFPEFSQEYLNEEGRFTERGERRYLDNIAGYVSYLNREKDARQFSQPIVKFVNTPLVDNIKEVIKLDRKLAREQMGEEINELNQQIEENNKEIDEEIKSISANKLAFFKNKCNTYDGKAKKSCEKIVREHIKSIVAEAKEGIQSIKDRIKELREAIKEKRDIQSTMLKEMKEDNSPEMLKKKAELGNSMYYAITRKCGKKISDATNLNEVIKDIPEVSSITREIERLDQVIENHKNSLVVVIDAHKNRLKQIKQLMKGKITASECELLKMTTKDGNKEHKQHIATLKKTIDEKVKVANKEKKAILKTRRKTIASVKKTMKSILQEQKEEAKTIAKETKAQEKILQQQEDYVHEFKNNNLKQIIEKHTNMMDEELRQNIAHFEELKLADEAKQHEKEIKAQEREIKAATRKQQKELRDEHRKTMKRQKEAENQEKKAAKEAEKHHKAAAKASEKREKEIAKEQERLAKEREKEAIKEQERLAKEQEKAKKIHDAAIKKLQEEQIALNNAIKKPKKRPINIRKNDDV